MEEEDKQKIMRITAEFLAKKASGRQPRLEDYTRRYPQYADEIVDFALYYAALESDLPDVSVGVPQLSAASRAALDQAWSRVATNLSLHVLASQQHYSLERLARELDLSVDIVEQLTARQLDPATIPHELLQRLSAVLTQSIEVVRQTLGVFEPASTITLAEERASYAVPSGGQVPAGRRFSEAIATSPSLSTEQREIWQAILKREKL